MFGPMRFITNTASVKLVESTARLFPEFFKGQPVDLHPQLIEMEKEGFARLIENDEQGSLILSGEASGRIQDLPKVKEIIDSIITDASETLRSLPGNVM
jgi:hypothetical protein